MPESGSSEPERPEPPRGLASRVPRPPMSPYSIAVGVAFVALAIFATLNTIRTDEGGILGADPTERGTALAEFAVPDARGSLEGDANVFQDDCATSRNPCPAGGRRTPACELSLEGVLRVCDYFDSPLVVSFWFTRLADCLGAQDEVDALSRRYGDRVGFLSVNVRDDRGTVREIVADRGWRMPVGHDADGAVSNLYRVGGCPTVLFAYPGGILAGALIGDSVTPAALERRVEGLLRQSRRRAEAGRER